MVTLSLPLPSILALIFFCALLIATVASVFLVYHWYAYGEDRAVSTTATVVYFSGVGAALLAMGGAVVLF